MPVTPTDRPATLVPRVLPGWQARPRLEPHVVGVLPGEGVGPEVIAVCLRLLEVIGATTGCRFEIRHGGKIGLDAERASGEVLTPAVVDFCRDVFAAQGAILCGPGGGRFVYELRARFDLFCKLAPLQPIPALHGTGVMRPEAVKDVDILVVRENTGGLYLGETGTEIVDGRSRAWQRFHYGEAEVDRLLGLAIRAAKLRRGQLCVVTKPSGVPGISALWRARAERLAHGSGVALRFLEIDTACYQLVADARSFDVVAAPNLFGDVLADGAGVLLGSRGLCYSANYTERGDAVYQTGHGAAYDLAGSDRANPGGQVLSLAMMLGESFARPDLRDAVAGALEDTYAAGWRTADVMGDGCRCVGTRDLGERIAVALASRLQAGTVPAGVATAGP